MTVPLLFRNFPEVGLPLPGMDPAFFFFSPQLKKSCNKIYTFFWNYIHKKFKFTQNFPNPKESFLETYSHAV